LEKNTFSMPTLHTPSPLSVAFDDDHAVANAGLALAGLLSEKLGLEELCEEMIELAPVPGRRVTTLVHALVAGASCIDDADILRAAPRQSFRTGSWRPRRSARSCESSG
jgi:UDP-N-acetylmuramyl pentapeptide synthase